MSLERVVPRCRTSVVSICKPQASALLLRIGFSVEYFETELPPLYIEGLKEFLLRLEQFIQEPIDTDTLLYGIDGKFYTPTIKLNNHFETSIHGLFLVGDCSGVTHSLSQAAASGLYVGKYLSMI